MTKEELQEKRNAYVGRMVRKFVTEGEWDLRDSPQSLIANIKHSIDDADELYNEDLFLANDNQKR